LQVEQHGFVTRHRYGGHVLELVADPDLGVGRLEHDDLDVAVTFEPQREAVEVGQHLLALDVDRRESKVTHITASSISVLNVMNLS
jgi:hypothetical protein